MPWACLSANQPTCFSNYGVCSSSCADQCSRCTCGGCDVSQHYCAPNAMCYPSLPACSQPGIMPRHTAAATCTRGMYLLFQSLFNLSAPTTTAPTKSDSPTSTPTWSPSATPTWSPSASPNSAPTWTPSATPSTSPTSAPTTSPTTSPSPIPTTSPSPSPSASPTFAPSWSPSTTPTFSQITGDPIIHCANGATSLSY